MTTSFITTAIPYVNARPHLGFAYELVLGDVLARHRRRRGRDVRFVTGTDDNSLKNVAAAAREGVPPRVLVDRNVAAFRALGSLLDVGPDDFITTSTDPRHRIAVDWLWRACAANGDFYQTAWEGRYCAGCEAFVDDDVTICAEHGVPPEPVAEPNWFFRLSRWREPVRDAIVSGRLTIVPEAARAETLALAGLAFFLELKAFRNSDQRSRNRSVSPSAARNMSSTFLTSFAEGFSCTTSSSARAIACSAGMDRASLRSNASLVSHAVASPRRTNSRLRSTTCGFLPTFSRSRSNQASCLASKVGSAEASTSGEWVAAISWIVAW
jgi:hypothetical protein